MNLKKHILTMAKQVKCCLAYNAISYAHIKFEQQKDYGRREP